MTHIPGFRQHRDTDYFKVKDGAQRRGILRKKMTLGFPGGPVVDNLPVSAENTDLIPAREGSTGLRATQPVCHNY